jgi:hypothetical protein
MGSGFYELKAGDYITMASRESDTGVVDSNVSCWHGYYKIDSVDIPNNKITIIFRRYQDGGAYASHPYHVPDGVTSGYHIDYMRHTCQIHYSGSGWFFHSDYGFGGFTNFNIACTNYLGANGIYVYDGVINDMRINMSYFDVGIKLKNLLYADSYSNNLSNTFITSCKYGILAKDCELYIDCPTINCCADGVHIESSSFYQKSSTRHSVYANNYNRGVVCGGGSSYFNNFDHTANRCKDIFVYNNIGIEVSQSEIYIQYMYAYWNHTGAHVYNKSSIEFVAKDIDTYRSSIAYNTYGINLNGSSCNTNCLLLAHNDYGMIVHNGYIISSDGYTYNTHIYSNSACGIQCDRGSTIVLADTSIYDNPSGMNIINGSYVMISYCDIYNNSSYGIRADYESNIKISQCNIHDNGFGIFATDNTQISLNYTSVKDNGNWGIRLIGECNMVVYNYNELISGNNNLDIAIDRDSHMNIYIHNAVPNTSPAKNTAPGYSDASGGTYVLETII